MGRVFLLALREYKAQVKTKGFIIGLVIAPFLMGGGIIAMILMEGQVDTTDKNVAVVDRSGLVADAIVRASDEWNSTAVYDQETGKKIRPEYHFEIVEPNQDNPSDQRLELSNRVRSDELHAFVDIGPGVLYPSDFPEDGYLYYFSENPLMDQIRGWLTNPVNLTLREVRLQQAGIEESQLKDLFNWSQLEGLELVRLDETTGEIEESQRGSELAVFITPFAVMMLMFFMIMMGATPQLFAVMEEKSQRIAEVILGSVKPFQFMMGKLIGGIGVSFTASLVYVLGSIFTVQYMGYGERIPYFILPWFFAYMILAIFMYGSVTAALGSACNDAADAQNLNLPAILPAIIPLFFLAPVIQQPNSAIATWMSLFPPFTPTLMLMRQSMPGGVPAWQPIVGLTGVVIFTIFAIWIGSRIFRVGLLMQGKPPSVGGILKWAFRG